MPLTIRVVAEDDDRVSFSALEVDAGAGPESVPLSGAGVGEYTAAGDSLLIVRARAADPNGNEGRAMSRLRAVVAAPGEPLVPTPLPGVGPELLGGVTAPEAATLSARAVAALDAPAGLEAVHFLGFDAPIVHLFSEPLAPSTLNDETVKLLDPQGKEVDIDLWLGVGNWAMWATPVRHLRYGATYTLRLTPGIQDLEGRSFAGAEVRYFVPRPVQVATLDLPNAQDVVLVDDLLVASKMAVG